jgi:hypothetical protein
MLGFGLQLLAFKDERKVASKEKNFDRLASTHFTSCNLSTSCNLERWMMKVEVN